MSYLDQTRTRRRGGVSVLFLGLVGLFLAALALAVDVANLWHTQAELQAAADAAALAAAQALADDATLTRRPGAVAQVVTRARAEAVAYGARHRVQRLPLELAPTLDNHPDGDLVFGFHEAGAGFQPAQHVDSPLLNAVRVTARRTRERGNPAGTYFARLFGLPQADVSAAATAVLDRHVVGFRPAGRIPVPLAPLALLSDPDKPRSWESQVEKPLAQPEPRPGDRFRYDRAGRRFLAVPGEAPVGDGLCEMEVRLPLEGQALDLDDADEANACLLQIGEPAWDVLCRQLAGGVTATDLANRAGQLRLETDAHYPQPRLFLPGSQLGPAAGSAELTQVLGALQTLRQTAEPRIWPLFHERHADGVEGQGTVVVVGFVAARVVQAQLAAEGTGPDQRTQLALILQPCQAVANAALTDAAAAINPYVSKPRLTE